MKTMSQKGLELLKDWEGCILHVYNDAARKPTIGIGHLLTSAEKASGKIMIDDKPVYFGTGITKDQAIKLLARDVQPAEHTVNTLVRADLNQNQFDALVSFVFNIGGGAFSESTLLKRINSGDFADVPNQFAKWVNAGGKRCSGLATRRNNEIRLWKGEI